VRTAFAATKGPGGSVDPFSDMAGRKGYARVFEKGFFLPVHIRYFFFSPVPLRCSRRAFIYFFPHHRLPRAPIAALDPGKKCAGGYARGVILFFYFFFPLFLPSPSVRAQPRKTYEEERTATSGGGRGLGEVLEKKCCSPARVCEVTMGFFAVTDIGSSSARLRLGCPTTARVKNDIHP
jgi:hypothetical protein